MKKIFFSLLLLLAAMFFACAPANITSAKWDSGVNDSALQTRCERVDMRSEAQMNKILQNTMVGN